MAELNRGGQSRALVYDVVRFIAITFVVLCHASESGYFSSATLGYSVLHYLGRLGVPLFFFLTGALVLPKKFDAAGIKRFYTHNLLGLLITLEVWIVIYNIYFWLTGSEVTLQSWFEMATFAKEVPLSHWWYMPKIVSMYLALPFLGIALQQIDTKNCTIPLVFAIIFAFVKPTLNTWCIGAGFEQIESTLTAGYLGGPYLTYVVLGYLIFRRGLLKDINLWVLGIALLLSSGFAIDFGRHFADLWYDVIWVLISGCCIAEVLRRVSGVCDATLKAKAPVLVSFITNISRGAFGIYLVHNLIRIPLIPYIPVFSSNSLRSVCLFAATWLLSALFVLAVMSLTKRMPRLRRVLLDA